MNLLLWIAQILLAGMFGMAGFMKAANTEKSREQIPWAGRHSAAFVRFTGVVEMAGAVGLLLPMITGILPGLTAIAAVGLVLMQGLAVVTEHIPNKEFKFLPVNLALLLLAGFVAAGRLSLVVLS